MKTYWDVPEHERAYLTEQQMQAFVDIELMQEGVVIPPDPGPAPVAPTVTLESRTVWQIGTAERYGTLRAVMAFEHEADARSVAAMNVVAVETDYACGPEFRHAAPVPANAVQPIQVFTLESIAEHRDVLTAHRAAVAEHTKAVEERSKALKRAKAAGAPVWDDWHEWRAKANRLDAIVSKFDEYVRLCDGSEPIAYRFLCKAFAPDDAAAALRRAGRAVPGIESADTPPV